ncbi:MAG: hypothetical protein RL695_1960 [Pseudomonadota bacterium]|jgi:hypothetical protein
MVCFRKVCRVALRVPFRTLASYTKPNGCVNLKGSSFALCLACVWYACAIGRKVFQRVPDERVFVP